MAYTGKSAAITNYDATPPLKPAGGAGGAGYLQENFGYVTTTTSDAGGSTYAVVRVRSDCYIKQLIWNSDAMSTSAAMDLGVYYSDNTTDFPTNPALPGTAINDNFFVDNKAVSSAVVDTDVTHSGSYTIDLNNEPLWQALGLSSDPGGYFDFVFTAETTVTTGGKIGLTVRFITV